MSFVETARPRSLLSCLAFTASPVLTASLPPAPDPDVFNVQLDLQPAFLGPALQPGAPTAFAVLDSGLATAAAGQAGGGDATGSGRGSLAQRVWGGAAAWGQVVARGWPGEYRLVASVESATGVYKVGVRESVG